MKVTLANNRYEAVGEKEERFAPKEAGFWWDNDKKVWYTTSATTAQRLAHYADPQTQQFIQANLGKEKPQVIYSTLESLFYFKGGYEYKDVPKAAGFRWNPDKKLWYTNDVSNARKLVQYATPEAQQAISQKVAVVDASLSLSRATNANYEIPVPTGLAYLGYQKAGIQYATERQATLIADEMGLGKTVQFIGILNNMQEYNKVLLICPASLKLNWVREMTKWLIADKTIAIVDTKKPFPDTNIVIINFDILKNFKAEIDAITWDVLGVDECHLTKSGSKTIRGQMIYGSDPRKVTDPAKVKAPIKAAKKVFLTGTPFPNRIKELFPIINYLDGNTWGNFFTFAKKYCDAKQTKFGWDFDGSSNLDDLQHQLRSTLMIRRLKKDVLKELPAKIRQVIELPSTLLGKQVEKEQKAWESFKAKTAKLKADVLMAQVSGSHEAYLDAVANLNAETKADFTELSALRLATSLQKVPFVVEHLNEVLEGNGKKVVVFAHHREVVQALQNAFPGMSVSLTGETSMQARQDAVDKFQTDSACRLFIGSIKAAGVGLTLTASSHVVFAELDWVPASMSQAEDRCLVENTLVFCLQSGNIDNMALLKIQDIKIGDKVLTHTGEYKFVTDVSNKEHRGSVTKIGYVGWDDPLECTFDHKILIKRSDSIVWVEAHQLLPSDSMVFPKIKKHVELEHVDIESKWRLYETGEKAKHCVSDGCSKPIEARSMCRVHYREEIQSPSRPAKPLQINSRYKRLPDRIQIDRDWLYLLGWYVAEGFSSLLPGKSRFVSFSGHEDEEPTLMKISATLEKIGLKAYLYRKKTSKGVELRVHSGELALWFRDWFGHMASNKTLPTVIMNLPPHQACEFLRGYTDGDGYQRKRQVEWVSASPVLCYQMALLAIKSGFIPTMRRGSEKSGNHWIGGYTKFGIGNARLNDQDDDYVYRPIRKVETRYDRVKVYDLTVEDDHSFTVGFSTVHNCHRIGQDSTVLVQHIVVDGSIDARMAHTLVRKQYIMDAALDTEHAKKDIDEVAYTEVSTTPVYLDDEQVAADRASRMEREESYIQTKLSKYDFGSIEKDSQTINPEWIPVIHETMRDLAASCDGANKKDGVGFNKGDSYAGVAFARLPKLSAKQAFVCREMIRFYQGQVSHSVLELLGLVK